MCEKNFMWRNQFFEIHKRKDILALPIKNHLLKIFSQHLPPNWKISLIEMHHTFVHKRPRGNYKFATAKIKPLSCALCPQLYSNLIIILICTSHVVCTSERMYEHIIWFRLRKRVRVIAFLTILIARHLKMRN